MNTKKGNERMWKVKMKLSVTRRETGKEKIFRPLL